ncbi:lysophospholipase L2 [Planctomyces bekefii]|uniref:Lysophospholipase L2 n=1 Tax=Planctomyces bekefii TaxID=1653850 RepID=A0A5C6M304_9PLAN|nr:lysophospholipase L2 [Planctomyces bekefii]
MALSESALPQAFETEIKPVVAAGEFGEFVGIGSHKIHVGVFYPPAPAKAAVLILTGYTESIWKYGEFILDLNRLGLAVYIMDHRGMGESGRFAENPQIVHVENFDDYVQDAKTFATWSAEDLERRGKIPLYLFGHSMGGLVGAFLLGRDHPFEKAILSTPLFEMKTGLIPPAIAQWVVAFNVWRGKGKDFAPGRSAFDPASAKVEESRTTHSQARFAMLKEIWRERPESVMSGPSNGWVEAALKASARSEMQAQGNKIPTIVFTAGEDAFVERSGHQRYCRLAPHCELFTIAGAHHELLYEIDEYRGVVLEKMERFFLSKAAGN